MAGLNSIAIRKFDSQALLDLFDVSGWCIGDQEGADGPCIKDAYLLMVAVSMFTV